MSDSIHVVCMKCDSVVRVPSDRAAEAPHCPKCRALLFDGHPFELRTSNDSSLGKLRIKSREEKLEESFRAWLVSRSLTPQQAEYLCLLKNRGIATGRVRLDDLFEPPLSILDAAGKGVELFGEEGLRRVVEDLNEGVFQTEKQAS